jgi:hypothetical protein
VLPSGLVSEMSRDTFERNRVVVEKLREEQRSLEVRLFGLP